jgi:hypothetical protein
MIRGSNPLFVPAQGGANRASSRTGQGAEDGRVHPHPAALVEGVAAGDKRGGGWGLEVLAHVVGIMVGHTPDVSFSRGIASLV